MQYQLKSIIPFFATVCTICCAFSAYADESNIASESLPNQIEKLARVDLDETVELVFDYIFSLGEQRKSPSQRIEEVIKLCQYDEVHKQFKVGPVFTPHWLVALKGYSVTDVETMTLLHRALSTIPNSSPQRISRQDSELLLNLAFQVEKVETSTRELQKIKAQTIWWLALIAQTDKDFGRQLGTLALEQIAICSDIPEGERRDALFRVFLSYSDTPNLEAKDGDLLVRNVVAAGKILKYSRNKYDFERLDTVYNELRRRCSNDQALGALQILVDAAQNLNVEEKKLDTVLLQLGCAYLRAGKPDKAEEVFSKQSKKPMFKVCLAESLRRQAKYAKADALLQQIAKTQFSYEIRYPSLYIGMANAIRAQSYIDQKKYQMALPLLKEADTWFSNSIAQENLELRDYPYIDQIVPSDLTVLSNLAFVYNKLGHKADALRVARTLSKVKSEKELNTLSVERDALLQAAQTGGNTENSASQAKRMVEVCRRLEKVPAKRANSILDYAESLIRNSKTMSAEVCISELEKNTVTSEQVDEVLKTRILVDRILIAEERNELDITKKLLKNLRDKTVQDTSHNELRIAEVESRFALHMKDYDKAVTESKIVETALETQSRDRPKDYIDSNRDKFANEHGEAILDRIQALNQVHKHKEAGKLARALLVLKNPLSARLGADCAAQLAISYSQDGHDGLAKSLQDDAAFRDRWAFPLEPGRYIVDAKETLSVLCERHGNPLRARRYRAEAKEIREQLDKNNSSQSSS